MQKRLKTSGVILICAAFLCSCSVTKKRDKSTTTTETQVVTKIDTLVKIPAVFDSTYAKLKELFDGVKIGDSEVKYDTITNYVYLKTPPKIIQIKAEKTETVKKVEQKDVKEVVRKNKLWLIIPALLLVISIIVLLKIKF